MRKNILIKGEVEDRPPTRLSLQRRDDGKVHIIAGNDRVEADLAYFTEDGRFVRRYIPKLMADSLGIHTNDKGELCYDNYSV